MIALGLVIVIAVIVIALSAGLGNSGADHSVHDFTVLGVHIAGSSGRLFIYGCVVGIVGVFGFNMILAGLSRSARHKLRDRRLRKAVNNGEADGTSHNE
jgi:hypothetical protein